MKGSRKAKTTKNMANQSIREIAVDNIMANPNQPRKHFDQTKLEELAESVKGGLIQPITVVERPRRMPAPNGEHFMIVAGERRWRAHQLAGKLKIRVIV